MKAINFSFYSGKRMLNKGLLISPKITKITVGRWCSESFVFKIFPVHIETQTNLKSVIVKLQQQQPFFIEIFLKFKIFFHGGRLADASLGGPVYESNYKHHDTNIEK